MTTDIFSYPVMTTDRWVCTSIMYNYIKHECPHNTSRIRCNKWFLIEKSEKTRDTLKARKFVEKKGKWRWENGYVYLIRARRQEN